jgi:hypothetical protein
MSASSATPKDYVDAILGSATAQQQPQQPVLLPVLLVLQLVLQAPLIAPQPRQRVPQQQPQVQTSAATSATSAAASATAAATSATSAETSATAAATSATSAETSATSAETSATSSATSASAAATSATSAATSATSAETSATSAATSATSAATSATSAATTYTQFDARYLGNKSADPTLDNEGNALLTGALYFNDVIDAMKVYDGAAWELVAPDTSDFIDKAILTAKGSSSSQQAEPQPLWLVAQPMAYIRWLIQQLISLDCRNNLQVVTAGTEAAVDTCNQLKLKHLWVFYSRKGIQ